MTSPPITPSAAADTQEWSVARLLAFRFLFVYFVLYLPPAVNWLLPGGNVIERAYDAVEYPAVQWLATNVFGRAQPLTIFSHGGDRTSTYFEVVLLTFIAALVCGVWSLISSRRAHPVLYAWTRVSLRYALALNMLSYGYAKLLRIQFPVPQLDRLLEPIGQTTPMGLLWTFMAYSPGYNVFAGAIEVIGAILLFWERTTVLGALLLTGALTNVLALNLAYDVPVRLYAAHLLAAAVALVAPHFWRLLTALTVPSAVSNGRPLAFAKILVIAVVLWAPSVQFRGLSASVPAPASPRYGIWEVDAFWEEGTPRPIRFGDATVWSRLVVTEDGSLSVQSADGTVIQWRTTDHVADRILELRGTRYPRDPNRRASLRYEEPAKNRLIVDGTYDGRVVRAMLHRVATPQFELLSHGFHWVNEYHHNR